MTMQGTTVESTPALVPANAMLPRRSSAPLCQFAVASGILVLCFAKPLYNLIRFSLSETFYSHILLIPFISGYLIWTERKQLPVPKRCRRWSGSYVILAVLSIAMVSVYTFSLGDASIAQADALFWTILPFCLLLTSLVLYFLGGEFARVISFPVAFLYFITPFPEDFTNALEIGSQVASAEVYSWMLSLTNAPHLRDGQVFSLPGLTLVVAQECSGVRSSFVLFLTSLLAGHMFLRSGWKKGILAFVVVPLGLFRNGFRVFVISMLTVYLNPNVIHSPLHHKGGPIFFALSLVPFFFFLFWLRRTEGSARGASASR